jgi:serine/threonine kinase 38
LIPDREEFDQGEEEQEEEQERTRTNKGDLAQQKMSYAAEDDEALEHTLLIVREVSVYKIPARSSSGGYKCAEWLQSDKIWTGRLKVISLKEKCEVRLEDPNTGELFAACPVLPGKRDATVENVADSSRYFVLRIDDGRGKHAFIGLGFAERNEAFDFNVALSDHEKYVKREAEKEQHGFDGHDGRTTSHPSLDLRLKVRTNHSMSNLFLAPLCNCLVDTFVCIPSLSASTSLYACLHQYLTGCPYLTAALSPSRGYYVDSNFFDQKSSGICIPLSLVSRS